QDAASSRGGSVAKCFASPGCEAGEVTRPGRARGEVAASENASPGQLGKQLETPRRSPVPPSRERPHLLPHAPTRSKRGRGLEPGRPPPVGVANGFAEPPWEAERDARRDGRFPVEGAGEP